MVAWQCQLWCVKLQTLSNTGERRTSAWIQPLQQKYPGRIYFVLGKLQEEKNDSILCSCFWFCCVSEHKKSNQTKNLTETKIFPKT